MKTIYKILTSIIGLSAISSPLITLCSCNNSHIKYFGPKIFQLEAYGQLDIECVLDKIFDSKTDSIELICSIDNFFEYTTKVDGNKLTIHLANNQLLSLEYDIDINLEIKIKTSNWTESIKGICFKYAVERQKLVKAHCFRATTVDITIGAGIDLKYSLDDKEWTSVLSDTSINIPAGNAIYFKGYNPYGLINTNIKFKEQNTDFIPSVYLMGNILALLDDGLGEYSGTLPKSCFSNLFWASKGLYGASPRFLRSTKLSQLCYANMFKDNYNFVYAPELPANELASHCYSSMFESCNELQTPPELPAKQLADGCYGSMFKKCLKLLLAPELPATTLAKWCYQNMFEGCEKLISTVSLPAEALADYCYRCMFFECKNLSIVKPISAKALANGCCNMMFYNCTNLKVVEDVSQTQFFTCPEYDSSTIKNPVTDMFSNTKDQPSFTPIATKTYSYE